MNTAHNIHKDGITQSLLTSYMQCPRKYILASNGYRGNEENTNFGTFFHNILELLHTTQNKKLCFQVIDKYNFPKEVQNPEYMRVTGSVLFDNYLSRYGVEKVQPELLLHTNNNPYKYLFRGKIDGVVKRGKDIWILETKTKTQISEENLQNRLALDFQSLFYMVGYWMQTKILPKGVIYNVIRYPQRKPKDLCDYADALDKEIRLKTDYFFYRWETEYTIQDVLTFQSELYQKLIELDNREQGKFYRNECSCDLYGGCDFLGYCSSGSFSGLKKSKLFQELIK